MQPEDSDKVRNLGRREAIKKILLLSVGTVAAFGSAMELGPLLRSHSQGGEADKQEVLPTSGQSLASGAVSTASSESALAQIKVIYMGMPKTATGTSSELVTLTAGSTFNDLLSFLMKRHPALAAMGPGMQVLLNGLAPYGNPVLQDGDEAYFLAMSAGG